MSRLRAIWQEIVRFWGETEAGTSMALVRIGVALCVVYDLLHIWRLQLVVPLFVAEEYGGWSHVLSRSSWPPWTYLFGASEASGVALHAAMTLAAVALVVGFRTRTAAAALLLLWIQWTGILPTGDRGIDQLIRNILVVMVLGDFGRTLSVDALARTGRWIDPTPTPAWPRRLVLGQMILMYTSAGFMKSGLTWWPMGGFAALYFALQDPSVAAYDFAWTRDQPWFFFTQIGTASTIVYQCTYPLVLLLFWWRRYPERAGRIGRIANRYRLEWIWLIVGAWFHVNLGLVMNLGIFPWAMLALYPAWFSADDWHRWAARWLPHAASPKPPTDDSDRAPVTV
jgi:hypothetical protein